MGGLSAAAAVTPKIDSAKECRQTSLDFINFEKLEKKFIFAFELVRLVQNYLNKALVLTMLCLLMWLLIATYYLMLSGVLELLIVLRAVVHFFTAILPLGAFLESTSNLNSVVSSTF